MKLAAIDVGSNAVRLLLARVFDNGHEPVFKKESLIRIPLRLGDEAFTLKQLSQSKAEQLINTMTGFKHLIEAYQAEEYMACATSAMRVSFRLKRQRNAGISCVLRTKPVEAKRVRHDR